MKIDRDMIVDLLQKRGQPDKAREAQDQLPQQVDHEDAGLLGKFGLDPQDLIKMLPGGLGDKLGGLGGLLGK